MAAFFVGIEKLFGSIAEIHGSFLYDPPVSYKTQANDLRQVK